MSKKRRFRINGVMVLRQAEADAGNFSEWEEKEIIPVEEGGE